MENRDLVIAVDGPSGSGKTSVGREVARRCGLAFLDTGAMYRAVTWAVMKQGIDPSAEALVAELAQQLYIILSTEPDREYVGVRAENIAGGQKHEIHEITEAVRKPEISEQVSAIAANLKVRRHLIRQQRNMIAALGHRAVVDGRDITTVVAPDAQLRLILTAREEVRMRRRGLQLHQEGGGIVDKDRLREQVVERDIKDSQVNEFMDAAEGVVVLDSSDFDFAGTVAAVMRLIFEKVPDASDKIIAAGEGGEAAEN